MFNTPITIPHWKRSIDIICCLIALPFLSIIALLMLVITKSSSPGPLFFKQERIGLRGKKFKIYKFRTMHVNSDTRGHQAHFESLVKSNTPMTKLDGKGDSRLIFGAWLLRASGLDELPQIINIFNGDMSIVGPRPCLPTEFELFSPWQVGRCDVVPGLTGLWQVSGKNRLSFDQMIRLDIEYSKSYSLWLDIKIISLTIPALFIQIYDTKIARNRLIAKQTVVTYKVPQTVHSSSPF